MIERFGDYARTWYAVTALALIEAAAHLPIREPIQDCAAATTA